MIFLPLPFLSLVLCLLLFAPNIWAADGYTIRNKMSVTLSYVIDGDSLMARKNHQEVHIRLFGIDAPEFDQPNSLEARQALSDLICGKKLDIEIVDIDRYGRFVAIVITGGTTINEALVASGNAWVYHKYCILEQCEYWTSLEQTARRAKIGLWREDRPIPPWEWKARKNRRIKQQ